MGCQHSRLNTIQNIVKPSPSQPQKGGNNSPPSYTKESKQNIPKMRDNINKEKKTTITPLNLQIITSDEPKISLSISKFDSEKIKICIEKIEAFQKSQQKNRKKMINSSSKTKFDARYIRQVLQFLQRRDDLYKKTIVQVRQKSGEINCSDCQLKVAIEQYFKQNPVPYFQVQTWVKEKTKNIRTYHEQLLKSLNDSQQYKQRLNIEQFSYVLNIMVEDLCDKQFSFKKNLALNYLYLNVLPQIQEWNSESHTIYEKLIIKFTK